MNKTIRNKALKEVVRLITVTYKGAEWACPQGHFATSAPIYDGYRVKKGQIIETIRPDLEKVLVASSAYEPADIGEHDPDTNTIRVGDVYMNFDYFNLLMDLHPDATPYVNNDYKLSPVEIREDGKLVAVIMPLRSQYSR